MLVVRNDDRPGDDRPAWAWRLGDAGVSIASMAVGPDPQYRDRADGAVDRRPRRPPTVIERLRGTDGIQDIHLITLR